GIDALPAPADFLVTERDIEESYGNLNAILINLLPDVQSLNWTTRALKEYIGLAAYRFAGWL
ncbi:MAG TPA: hypothetical protein VMB26_06350, partial [Candidatus Binataceae bacterium]|nr:hypothetical protein [Candidatus Binataceae bacterium]